MTVKPIPDGYHTVTPYLVVPRAADLIAFLKEAFGAREVHRMTRPDGTLMHAEVRIGNSAVMMGEPTSEFGPMPSSLYLYVEDCDAVYQRALGAGGVSVMEPTDMPFAGERYGGVKDPSGNIWWVATHIEDVSPEEQGKRAEVFFRQQQQGRGA